MIAICIRVISHSGRNRIKDGVSDVGRLNRQDPDLGMGGRDPDTVSNYDKGLKPDPTLRVF